MKKIIFLSIACFFFSQVIHAQGSSLENFFNHYAEKDGFTYIYQKGGKDLLGKIPSDIKKELRSATFIKSLSCNNAAADLLPADFLSNLKDMLLKQNFELVRMVKSDGSRIETYQRVSDHKDFDDITIIITGIKNPNIFIRWISGTTK